MYNIMQDKERKILVVTLTGNIDTNQANTVLNEFKKTIASLISKDYILIINPENISANLFVIPILQSFVKLISELHFKRIYLTNSDKYAALIKQQLVNTDVATSLSFAADLKQILDSLQKGIV